MAAHLCAVWAGAGAGRSGGGASLEGFGGAGADSPADFITRLVAKDEGWLAAYFDAFPALILANRRTSLRLTG